jgi:zinc transport system substrate-binding protein
MTVRAMRKACAALALLGVALAAGCGASKAPPASQARIKVVATIYPLYDWVRQVGGDAVDPTVLLKPGESPHTFEPTPSTAMNASQAKVVVAVGLGLDGWIERIAGDPKRVVKLGEVRGIALIRDKEGVNPHVWMDPQRAIVMVRALEKALAAADPAHAAMFHANAVAYQAQLRRLSDKIAEQAKPYRGRSVITFHNAFTYLLDRCGLRLAGAIEPFPGKEPSAQYLQALTATARRLGQRVIFAEPQLSPKAAQVIANEIGGHVGILDDTGTPSDPRRATYTALVQYDVDEIVRAVAEEPKAGPR